MTYEEYKKVKHAYQEYGHLSLLDRKHACLFYKPGKGKTYPAIDAVRDINDEKGGKAKVLVLSTPDAIKNMWLAEIDTQNIMPEYTVYMTFNSAIVDKRKLQLLKVKWDVIIIDESHKIKAHNTKISKLVFQLTKDCEYVFGLSGTPIGNNEIDIFCQFHNMHISEWGNISYTQFVNICCETETNYFGGKQIIVPKKVNDKYRVGWDNNVAHFAQFIDYEDDDIPKPNVELVILPYTPTKEYLLAEDGVISIQDYETTLTKLTAIQKCHQAANGFLYITDEDGNKTTHVFEVNGKLKWLKDNLTNEPTVIVYMFQADLVSLKEELTKDNISFTEDVNLFKEGNINVLLLQCSRCESFNLQMCKNMIYYTFDYSYIKYNQMLHRIYRMGQTEPVNIKVLAFDKTIELSIWKAVQNKEKLSDMFMSFKGEVLNG